MNELATWKYEKSQKVLLHKLVQHKRKRLVIKNNYTCENYHCTAKPSEGFLQKISKVGLPGVKNVIVKVSFFLMLYNH